MACAFPCVISTRTKWETRTCRKIRQAKEKETASAFPVRWEAGSRSRGLSLFRRCGVSLPRYFTFLTSIRFESAVLTAPMQRFLKNHRCFAVREPERDKENAYFAEGFRMKF